MRRPLTTLLALLATLVAVGSALAVTGGTEDTTHTYAGAATQVQTHDGVTGTQLCSGVLVSPTVFVTAAHCFPDGSSVTVTFDANYKTAVTTYTGTVHDSTQVDVAVIVFGSPITSVGLATLPSLGYDDTLPNNQVVDVVGYGVRSFDHRVPLGSSVGPRMMTTTPVKSAGSLGDASLKLLADPGACFGDSGGPNLVDGTNLLVAITSGGNANCKGVSYALRVDTPAVRDFLAGFVSLP